MGLKQGCTTQISWWAKKNYAKMSCFYLLKGCIYQENKLEAQHLGLSGPNEKLLRATFGPRPCVVHALSKVCLCPICKVL